LKPDTDLGLAGKAADWQPICTAARAIGTSDNEVARAFFERFFAPFVATNRGKAQGLFTGYYQVTLAGRLTPEGRFTVPIYGRPTDLVTVDLGRFRRSLRGDRIAGRVEDGRLLPFPDRAAIDRGALKGRAPVLAWVADPVSAFFMQIQGSGEIELPQGNLQLGYAADNGRDYYAIGRYLIKKGVLTPKTVSLQSIRAWLEQHPDKMEGLLERDPSYVFFRKLDTSGPVGASGAVLTARRSLAVDHRFIPYGVPVWLATTRPSLQHVGATVSMRRLMIAQDTGGAIRGPVRGDVYWGRGPRAAALAGEMKQEGRYWLLLPTAAALRVASRG
jgi:membrane-bound lytic murein transglycosylase A